MLELVPFSGIQFLDFELDLANLTAKARRFGIEYEADDELLVPLEPKDSADGLEVFSEPYINTITDFEGQWLPAPIFKVAGQRDGLPIFEPGPTTWARMRVDVKEWIDGNPSGLRFQFAMDTAVDITDGHERGSGVYYAPSKSDVVGESVFELVTDVAEVGWFLQAIEEDEKGHFHDPQEWVTTWLERILQPKLVQRRQKKAFYWARYLTLLEIASEIPITLKLINNIDESAPRASIDTNFVIDLGNSRTCGILLEKQGVKHSNIRDAAPFTLRNLSQPAADGSELIDSRAELCRADFGFDDIAIKSGRKSAFVWPSPVRLGSEALSLQRQRTHGQGPSGLSSSKRYLWDRRPAPIPWEFNNQKSSGYNPIEELVRLYVLEDGTFNKESMPPLSQNTFSRSSFMMFMIAELITQALMQINNPQDRLLRLHPGLPRRLSKIIFTIPTATPAFEQNILRKRAEDALEFVWSVLEIPPNFSTYKKPELVIQWDEASSSQQVFLYNEIGERFKGKAEEYLERFGTTRIIENQDRPTVRIASIDIGGGTTDLMIITYAAEQKNVIHPYQEFRESFRVAGDDLLKSIIETKVLPAIENALIEAGGSDVRQIIASYFQKNDQELTAEKSYLANSYLKSVAIDILKGFEGNSNSDGGLNYVSAGAEPDNEAKKILGRICETAGVGWPEMPLRVQCSQKDFNSIVYNTFFQVCENIAAALGEFKCDYVLLTGRPSKLQSVRRLFSESFAVNPSQLVSMHEYVVSDWYPFRDVLTGKIGDPKSTVTVGALLNSISRADLANYSFNSEQLVLKSTSNYIGEMTSDFNISSKDVIIDNVNSTASEDFTFIFTNTMYIGARQIDDEGWVALPLYCLSLDYSNLKLPLSVTVRRPVEAFEADQFFLHSSKDYLREYIKIVSIEDSAGEVMPHRALDLQFNTLGHQNDYWLESGLFS